jgi:hypothetical protein
MSTKDDFDDPRFLVGAFCPVHGLFKTSAMAVQPGATFAANNLGTNCAVSGCTYICEIIPGLYKGTEQGLTLLVAKSISREALAALKSIAEKVRDGKITPEQAEDQAKQITPVAAGLFKKLDPYGSPGAGKSIHCRPDGDLYCQISTTSLCSR